MPYPVVSGTAFFIESPMTTFPVPTTLPTEENKEGGVMIVLASGYGPQQSAARRSFFSDTGVDKGAVLNRFVTWFDQWSLPLAKRRGADTSFDRRFFCIEWPESDIGPAHGPQQVARFADRIDELVRVVEERRPKIVVFLSCYLWQAVNLPDSMQALKKAWGAPKSAGRRLSSHRLGAFHQSWDKVEIIALPMPSKNTTDAFVLSLAQPVHAIFDKVGFLPDGSSDPLILQAARCLVLDKDASIQRIRTQLHITPERARALFNGLQGVVYEQEATGQLTLKS
jgi:hypothetical protein